MTNVGRLTGFSPDTRLRGYCLATKNRRISPGSAYLDVHCVNFRAYPPVQDNRCGHDDRNPQLVSGIALWDNMVYGRAAIVITLIGITLTISTRISETRIERSTTVRDFAAFIAIALRGTPFLLAFATATWSIVSSFFRPPV